MQRRDFLKGMVAGGAAHFSVYSEGAGFAHRAKESTGLPILEDSVYAGHRYEAMVPDTLDLAGRAELAINGIGGTIDTDLDYYMFFLVRYACKTPYMAHHAADSTCDTKYGESFPLMRLMCGTDHQLPGSGCVGPTAQWKLKGRNCSPDSRMDFTGTPTKRHVPGELSTLRKSMA